MAGANRSVRNVALAVIVLGCSGYAGYAIYHQLRAPQGTNVREIVLVCTACGAESHLSPAEFDKLLVDEETMKARCPKCGAASAYIGILRCPNCGRWIPRTPDLIRTEHVCPFCKAPLSPRYRAPG